jgi:hypothetical protein
MVLQSECLRATQRKVAPRLLEKPLLSALNPRKSIFSCSPMHLDRAKRAKKDNERSEFIVAFAALASQTGITKNCPLAVSDSEQQ